MMHSDQRLLLAVAVLAVLALLAIPPASAYNPSKKCFADAIPDKLVDRKNNLTLLQYTWNSNLVVNEMAQILLAEKLGVASSAVPYYDLVARILEQTGIDYSPLTSRYVLRDGYADADLENWDETIADQTIGVPGVTEALLGYVGNTGWYTTSYVTDYNSDYQSYIPLKYAQTASLFDPNVVSSIDRIPAVLTPAQRTTQRLTAPECMSSSSSYNITACILRAYEEDDSSSTGFGTIHAPNATYWGTMEAILIKLLKLRLVVDEINPPIDEGIVSRLQDAYSQRRPWLGYLYTPHAVFSRYSGFKLVQVTLPKWTSTCNSSDLVTDSYACGYSTTFVKRFVSDNITKKAPQAYSFLTSLRIDEIDMNDILGAIQYLNLTVEDATCQWLRNNTAKWQYMIPEWHRAPTTCQPGTELQNLTTHFVCSRCTTGTFNLVTNGTCRACPAGAICPGGSELLVEKGYWYDSSSAPTSPLFFPCANGNCCEKPPCALNAVCPADRTGNMCSACADPNFSQWNGVCADCSTNGSMGAGLLSVPVFSCLVVIAAFMVLGSSSESLFVSDLLLFFQLAGFVLHQDDLAQIIVLKLATLNVDSIFNGMVPSGVCVLPLSNLDRIIVKAVMPFAFWLALGFYHAIALAYSALKVRYPRLSRVQAYLPPQLRHVTSIRYFFLARYFILFTLTFMPVVEGALKLLNCRQIGSRGRFLVESPDVLCFAGHHVPAFLYAIIVLVIWVGVIPVMLFARIRRLMRMGRLGDPEAFKRLGVFYASYKKSHAYYGVVDLVKRATVVMASVVIPKDSNDQYLLNLMVVLMILWLYLLEHWYSRPLHSVFENHFRIATYASMFVLCASSMLKVSGSTAEFLMTARYGILIFFLVIPLLLIPWFFLWHVLVLRRKAISASSKGSLRKRLSRLGSMVKVEQWDDARVQRLTAVYRWFGSEHDLELTDEVSRAHQ
ncbi:hypothetical protein H9P43_010015 [Blastocladiella emersonii ATCC 22665]|nr:hypothetical protein H9P43_010015 [Blastocladiella emersonii ATCC 22665]